MDLRKIKLEEERARALANKKKKKGPFKRFGLALSALILTTILTTIAVDATDNIQNLSRSLIGSALTGTEELAPCPEDMTFVSSPEGGFCIDTYEASPSDGCVITDPQNKQDSIRNLEQANCMAVSEPGRKPWTNVARHQAELACAQAGKHLPSNEEWYRASLGTPDTKASVARGDCNLREPGGVVVTGTNVRCVSSQGVHDMIGNVWEWVGEDVYDGVYEGRALPDEGYVVSVDVHGVPTETNTTNTDASFNEDYFFVDKQGTRGMIRGGYFGSGSDGGQYAINAITPPSFTGAAVGFRCAR